jgi:hypothetical protein
VRLVDHQHPRRRRQLGKHRLPEIRVVEPLRADQQHVDPTGEDLALHLLPLVQVRRVDRRRLHTGTGGRVDLVAHQREQRRHDDGRTGAEFP